MKQTFTQIPDNWNALDLESRFILAYMLRYQDNGKQYFAKIETFCKTSGIQGSCINLYDIVINTISAIRFKRW